MKLEGRIENLGRRPRAGVRFLARGQRAHSCAHIGGLGERCRPKHFQQRGLGRPQTHFWAWFLKMHLPVINVVSFAAQICTHNWCTNFQVRRLNFIWIESSSSRRTIVLIRRCRHWVDIFSSLSPMSSLYRGLTLPCLLLACFDVFKATTTSWRTGFIRRLAMPVSA